MRLQKDEIFPQAAHRVKVDMWMRSPDDFCEDADAIQENLNETAWCDRLWRTYPPHVA